MQARKLILNNCFSYRELLEMKRSYAKAVREVYGKGGSVASDETFEDYILVIADSASNMVFVTTFISIIGTIITAYNRGTTDYNHGIGGVVIMSTISLLAISAIILRNSRNIKTSVKTLIKLLKLRVKMYVFSISPPL